MNKPYNIEVTALQNGYLVEAAYKVYSKDAYDGWNRRVEKFVFLTWTEIVDFMEVNPLAMPPIDPMDDSDKAVDPK